MTWTMQVYCDGQLTLQGTAPDGNDVASIVLQTVANPGCANLGEGVARLDPGPCPGQSGSGLGSGSGSGSTNPTCSYCPANAQPQNILVFVPAGWQVNSIPPVNLSDPTSGTVFTVPSSGTDCDWDLNQTVDTGGLPETYDIHVTIDPATGNVTVTLGCSDGSPCSIGATYGPVPWDCVSQISVPFSNFVGTGGCCTGFPDSVTISPG